MSEKEWCQLLGRAFRERSVGKPSDGHPKTACPALFVLKPCSLCGADGYDNHTLMHCPSQKKVKLQLRNGYRRLGDCKRSVERLPMWNSTEALFAAIY
ncbi:unnamed protein product [Heligmosomoides polygyrus]|uniref:Nanos-type domain-containing protein n=1 Tax=Heligmosomoides polygyrus TaxID=6339 RepID=A0A183FKQ7_HELPZ|nr:unnamed protein product [Heligmosomoides polygyrus]